MTNSKWLFLTSALGEKSWLDAANRLVSQADKTGLFARHAIASEDDVLSICPEYLNYLNEDFPSKANNFGFYLWKSTIAHAALSDYWGNFDGVAYLDAGSELFVTGHTNKVLKSYISNAERKGVTAFQINTPESNFTKREVFDEFPVINFPDMTGQFQAGGWFLHGNAGRDIARTWNQKAWAKKINIDDQFNREVQVSTFVAPRFDQSLFSLTCKTFGVSSFQPIPVSRVESAADHLRAFLSPIWWLRNRSGKTLIPHLFRVLTVVYLRFVRLS